jgi:hypothetical protein
MWKDRGGHRGRGRHAGYSSGWALWTDKGRTILGLNLGQPKIERPQGSPSGASRLGGLCYAVACSRAQDALGSFRPGLSGSSLTRNRQPR